MVKPHQHPSSSLSVIPCPSDKRREALLHLAAAHDSTLQQMLSIALKGMVNAPDEQWQGLWVSYLGGQMNGAVWVQCLPGNMARLWLPRMQGVTIPGGISHGSNTTGASVHALLDAAYQWVKTHNIRLCHLELAPQAHETETLLLQHDMQPLVTLAYLTCNSTRRLALNSEIFVSLQPFSKLSDIEQLDLLAAVGRDSLDSCALRDILSVQELLAGFYRQDAQAPEHWYAVSYQQALVGVLLLAARPALDRWELLLMGLTPEWRGQGLGRALLNKALSLTQQAGIAEVMLAVDELNLPARRIYQQAGFKTYAEQRLFAWKGGSEPG